jgi:hypothetical protein
MNANERRFKVLLLIYFNNFIKELSKSTCSPPTKPGGADRDRYPGRAKVRGGAAGDTKKGLRLELLSEFSFGIEFRN